MSSYPYYVEGTHDRGVVSAASGNKARDTIISNAEGRLVLDVVDRIFMLETNISPLTALLTNVGKDFSGGTWKGSGMLKASTINPEFMWIENTYGGRYAKNSGTYAASGAVTITVTGAGSSSAYIFTPGDVIKNVRTGENMLVDTVASTTTITIASGGRAFGSTAAAAGADGDELLIIGNANEENSGARNVNNVRSSRNSNYTQIFRTSIAATGTAQASKLYGGNELDTQRRIKGIEHARDIERAFFFGQKKYDTSGTQGHARRTTGGVLEFIEQGGAYVQDQDGMLTAPDFNTFLREGFTYNNGGAKTLFAGGKVVQAINEFARGQLNTETGANTYGVKVSTYMSTWGDINIVHHPLFVGEYAGYGFLLDVENCFRYRYMDGRDSKLRLNIQAPDIDGQVDEYLTECGLERKNAPYCALLKGVRD